MDVFLQNAREMGYGAENGKRETQEDVLWWVSAERRGMYG